MKQPYSFFTYAVPAAIGVLAGLMVHGLFWISPGHAGTYRCHDESGARVLTDVPAQLLNCMLLPTPVPSSIYGGTSTSQDQPPEITSPQVSVHDPLPDTAPPENELPGIPSGEDTTVPLVRIGGSYVVQVMLNGERPAHLIVDTGASMTVLSTDAAIELGILGTTDSELMTVNTAGGSVQVNSNILPSIAIATAQATNVQVVIHDLPDIPEWIEGLLGMSFLKHFLVTLDAEHARLILRPKQQQKAGHSLSTPE